MAEIANPHRLRDLRAALKRAKDEDILSLEQLAHIYDVTRPRFVNIKSKIPSFPANETVTGTGGQYWYNARKALQALIDYENRHEEIARTRKARTAAILGVKKRGQSTDKWDYKPSDLQVLHRLAQGVRQEEIDQGLYVPAAQVAAVGTEMFSLISEFFGGLSNRIDPHGQLEPQIRLAIDDHGEALLLQIHGKVGQMLEPNAKRSGNGATASRTRKARA